MPGKIDAKLAELGLTLPAPRPPGGNYVPFVVSGKLVFLAGQVSALADGTKVVGKLGAGVTIEQGQQGARLCALNLFTALRNACGGDLDRVARCVSVRGFVNCTPEFPDQPKVINGASDLIAAVFGEAGKHARTAIGVAALPSGLAVEVDAVFELA